jgi:hypothetical protein
MWNDFLGAEGTDREVKMIFRLFDVTIKGFGPIAAHPRRKAAPDRHPDRFASQPDHARRRRAGGERDRGEGCAMIGAAWLEHIEYSQNHFNRFISKLIGSMYVLF